MSYRIFDSMDRPASWIADSEHQLIDELRAMQDEAEEEGWNLSFSIGKILDDGNVTYDY